jgi:hypothetical protein
MRKQLKKIENSNRDLAGDKRFGAILLLLCSTQIFNCKRISMMTSRIESGASGQDEDFEKMSVQANWDFTNPDKISTKFRITDGNKKQYLASPSNINVIAKKGTISESPEDGKFISLGQASDLLVPSIDFDLLIDFESTTGSERRYQWCHTPNPIPFGAPGDVRCYKQESSRGLFVTACLRTPNTSLRVEKDMLKCSSVSTTKQGDHVFDYNMITAPGKTIEALSNFRILQSVCVEGTKVTNTTMVLDTTDPERCICGQASPKAEKAYDLWKVADYFMQKKSTDMKTDFNKICSTLANLPITGAPEVPQVPTESPEATAAMAAQFQSNVYACNQLKAVGYATTYLAETAQCACPPIKRADGSIIPPKAVELKASNLQNFIDQCLSLDVLMFPEICTQMGMSFVPKPGVPQVDRCEKLSTIANTAPKECPIFASSVRAELVVKCLDLKPKIPVAAGPATGGAQVPIPTGNTMMPPTVTPVAIPAATGR